MKTTYKTTLTCLVVFLFSSCEDFVQVDLPNSQISTVAVYENDETAIAAATSMYSSMVQTQSLIGGLFNSITYLGGLSSDELIDNIGTAPYSEFYSNQLTVNNSVVFGIWSSSYNTIYTANAVIEGATASTSLSVSIKKQIEGEAKFVRAFCNFYLVNLFGDIPLVTLTDYRKNAILSRSPSTEVYNWIISDLKDAKNLLLEDYQTGKRIRPKKWAASAMLARVYLYMKDYANAETEATFVINATDKFSLVTDLDDIFLTNSNEAIWQLSQVYPHGIPTADAFKFLLLSYGQSVTPNLLDSFESGDARKTSWLQQNGTVYYPYKYKTMVYVADSSYPEYLMVLRLAEQYLIRSEARVQQDNIDGSKGDINAIRNRAGLNNTTANDKISLMQVIQQERRIELFCEFGHRWLDLKRTGQANSILEPLKSSWNTEDQLYPIPASEMTNDPHLKPQNPGY